MCIPLIDDLIGKQRIEEEEEKELPNRRIWRISLSLFLAVEGERRKEKSTANLLEREGNGRDSEKVRERTKYQPWLNATREVKEREHFALCPHVHLKLQ